MFSACKSLINLDLSNFNTSNVTNMRDMFMRCSGLTSLNLSNFDTSNVTDIGGMFYDCSGLTSLNLSNIDTSKVTDMGSMFSGCSGLTSLNLGNFNMQACTNFNYMFDDCSALNSLTLPYNLQSGYTINLPSAGSGYYYTADTSDIAVGAYSFTKIGTETDIANGVIVCSTASKKVEVWKNSGAPDKTK